MVRFYWRRDIGKKTKIMRKVKFPFELDLLDLLDDEIKEKVTPVNSRLKEIQKDRQERAKIRKRSRLRDDEGQQVRSAGSSPTDPFYYCFIWTFCELLLLCCVSRPQKMS
jgi:ubiquitin carboxyl-terminal hydrolase 14